MIVLILAKYFPEWAPPVDSGKTWTKCLCPSHAEDRPSASVSFELNSIRCMACGFGGDHIKIIMDQEGVSYREALSVSASLAEASGVEVPRSTARKQGRRVFGVQGSSSGQGRQVPPWVRE